MTTLVPLLLQIAGGYLLAGLLFGIVFVVRGVERVDPAAQGAGWGFRLLILPGVAAFWPLLAHRWLRGIATPPLEHNAHRDCALKRRREERS